MNIITSTCSLVGCLDWYCYLSNIPPLTPAPCIGSLGSPQKYSPLLWTRILLWFEQRTQPFIDIKFELVGDDSVLGFHLQFSPMEMILGESDPQTYPSDEELLPIVDSLLEDVVVLGDLLLVDLPGEVGGGVWGLTAAVQLQQVPDLVLLDVQLGGDGRRLVGKFCNEYFSMTGGERAGTDHLSLSSADISLWSQTGRKWSHTGRSR